ncbi:IS1249 family transposase [soil metagenome]
MIKRTVKKRGFRYCRTCQNKLQRRGKTAAGSQRWYCQDCRKSKINPRIDLRRGFVFESFLDWLLGKDSQAELDLPCRTFRDQTAWCWQVPIPAVLTGEIHHAIIIDGLRVGGQVCLIARTTKHVIAWHWADRENSTNWLELLRRLPDPNYVVCDGQKGMLKALAICWPNTVVQRCRFHVWLNVKSKLTLNPQSIAGLQLLDLSRELLRVRSKRQARSWKAELKNWHRRNHVFIAERTIKDNPKPGQRTWRYAHERLRSAYRQLARQTDDLLRSSYRPHPQLPRTTNHLEGGINSQIRGKLGLHRGMPNHHQKALVNWYLYTRTETPKLPRKCL